MKHSLGAELKIKNLLCQFSMGKLYSEVVPPGISVLKGLVMMLLNSDMVDGITGAMTCNGVTDMFKNRLSVYANF